MVNYKRALKDVEKGKTFIARVKKIFQFQIFYEPFNFTFLALTHRFISQFLFVLTYVQLCSSYSFVQGTPVGEHGPILYLLSGWEFFLFLLVSSCNTFPKKWFHRCVPYATFIKYQIGEPIC
jgi:hypothetical protein